jgi:hypothetical protein
MTASFATLLEQQQQARLRTLRGVKRSPLRVRSRELARQRALRGQNRG